MIAENMPKNGTDFESPLRMAAYSTGNKDHIRGHSTLRLTFTANETPASNPAKMAR
jgi:hypothetical protein